MAVAGAIKGTKCHDVTNRLSRIHTRNIGTSVPTARRAVREVQVSTASAPQPHVGKGPYQEIYARSMRDPIGFWEEAAGEIDWYEPASKVFDPTMGLYGRWF